MLCYVVRFGYVFFNENIVWYGFVDILLWKGKNVLKWILVYRSFLFFRGIILKVKLF